MKVATSETHPLRVDFVPVDGVAGRLGLTFAPGKKASSSVAAIRWERDLDTDLRALVETFGTDVLVSLMRPYEYDLLGIPDLLDRAREHGMDVEYFPIDDVSVPDEDGTRSFRELIHDLHDRLSQGQSVTVHCRGGLGRSGLVAACVLVRSGVDPAGAIAAVRRHRPGAIETEAQEQYVHAYAEWKESSDLDDPASRAHFVRVE